MAFQAVPNGIEVVVAATQNGVPVVNVYHVKTAGAVSDAALLDAAEVFRDHYVTLWLPNKHPSYTLNTITATDISVEDGHQVQVVLTTGNVGTATGAAAGGQVAGVQTWKTANIGRSYRGRTYQGGLTTDTLTNAQTLSNGQVAYMVTTGTALIDALQNVGLILSVLSRVLNGVTRIVGVLTEIVTVSVDNKVDTQRRRTAN